MLCNLLQIVLMEGQTAGFDIDFYIPHAAFLPFYEKPNQFFEFPTLIP